ncbi:MAG TPA: helix-turn-helix domain-containing protein [Candidatus Ornithomonoglobus intestinigallinarum]|uniref:Helix-turn-helix domain-containing protein n=1 Tax=Candidatus Ornithomonoglobus intestinigallinarum TaxID=2840894 RepID=A0A9D1KPP5_9FIRM|nr:helix-turn-helix domain-containing protein [Candidatus Ornithomonoglobus intestinigallinarum]
MEIFEFIKKPKHIMFILRQILIPLVIIMAAMLIISGYSFYHNKTQTQSAAYSTLKYYSYHCEANIENVINSVDFLQNDTVFIDTLQGRGKELDSSDLYSVRSTLSNFADANDVVDSIIIMDPDDNYVITSDGFEDFNGYLAEKYCYSSYNSVFWRSIKFLSNSQHRVYAPTVVVTDSGETKNIIPIAFKKLDMTNFSSLLVVNVSLSALLNMDFSHQYMPDADIYILNKMNGNIFSADSFEQSLLADYEPLYNRLITGEETFDFTLKDYGKSSIVAVSDSDSMTGYTYFAVIPYRAIYAQQLPFIIIMFVIILLFVLWAYLFALRSARNISRPIEQIADVLQIDSNKDLFEDIKTQSSALSSRNSRLSCVLPFALENYLINYLNSNESSDNAEALEFLKESLPFKYDLFKVIVLKIIPTSILYKEYDSDEFSNFKTGFYNIVKESFREKYNCVFLSSEKNSLYIILNFDSESLVSNVEQRINELYTLLSADMEYLICYAGVSNSYDGLDGLRKAHTEALQRLHVCTPPGQSRTAPANQILFDLSSKEENNLFSKLVSAPEAEVIELLSEINKNNAHIDPRSKKQLYLQILNIVCRVMRLKNIPLEQNRLDFEVYSELITKDENEIYNYILDLTHRLASAQSSSGTLSGDDKLIRYLNDNFKDPNLSLDSIATEFNTTPSYVSTIVKQKLGIPFSKYVSNLRVTEAMRLLEETNMNITEIITGSGFNSKQAFYRTFKSIAGMPPSEYRDKKRRQ